MLLKSKLTSTLQSMALFLANKDTEYILFKPVKVTLPHVSMLQLNGIEIHQILCWMNQINDQA